MINPANPWERGDMDSYYHRPRSPHKMNSQWQRVESLTPEEIADYHAGYDWNEKMGDKKDWGGSW